MSNRPLSPHLQIYRLPMLAILSITHRMTGVALSVGTLLLVYWLYAAASGPESFDYAQGIFGSMLGQLVLFIFTLALFYHMCNGIRHLFWDMGYGFKLADADRSGRIVIGVTVVLTILTWLTTWIMH